MLSEGLINLKFTNFSHDGVTFVTMFGILDCALLCLNTKNCPSFFYSNNFRSCALTSTRYMTKKDLKPQAGIDYYNTGKSDIGMRCSSTAECRFQNSECSQGGCQCAVGYSYRRSEDSCVKHCREYGADFSIHPGYGIYYNNKRHVKTNSTEVCMDACRKETTFVCINIDFEMATSKCQLCDKAWFDVPTREQDHNAKGWILFYRHCSY